MNRRPPKISLYRSPFVFNSLHRGQVEPNLILVERHGNGTSKRYFSYRSVLLVECMPVENVAKFLFLLSTKNDEKNI
ncbi:hypothetical protein ACSBR2_010064 [Camellia fascicularis]